MRLIFLLFSKEEQWGYSGVTESAVLDANIFKALGRLTVCLLCFNGLFHLNVWMMFDVQIEKLVF